MKKLKDKEINILIMLIDDEIYHLIDTSKNIEYQLKMIYDLIELRLKLEKIKK